MDRSCFHQMSSRMRNKVLPLGMIIWSSLNRLSRRARGSFSIWTGFHQAPPLKLSPTIPQARRAISWFGAGPRLIQDLRPGDTVKDVDGADVAILWIGSRHVTFSGDNAPRPILISEGAISHNCPSSDLMVSPQHRMRLTGPSVRSVFGEDHVLAPARGLTSLRGIREMKGKTNVTYVALLLTRHAVLRANGAATESLYPGPQALRALPSFQRQLVYRAVPDLAAEGAGNPRTRTTYESWCRASKACKLSEIRWLDARRVSCLVLMSWVFIRSIIAMNLKRLFSSI